MNKPLLLLVLFFAFTTSAQLERSATVIVIHGGAGTWKQTQLSPDIEAAYRSKLVEAVQNGYKILQNSGRSVDAVVGAIRILESSPLFKAGVGSVLTWKETP